MNCYRFAVIGDIHANLQALNSALEVVKKTGCDELIFLGDVLGYGVDVHDVTERIWVESQKPNVVLLRGNHDAMYLSADKEKMASYVTKLPEWIRETVDFTRERLPSAFDALPFVDALRTDKVFFAHANPFGRDDWRYLNTEKEHSAACVALQAMDVVCGVFGHTHRAKCFSGGLGGAFLDVGIERFDLTGQGAPYVLNAGSVGQPRGEHDVYVLFLDVDDYVLSAHFRKISFDVHAHIAGLRQSGLRDETIKKLVSFFV